jgi:hypothetical protein
MYKPLRQLPGLAYYHPKLPAPSQPVLCSLAVMRQLVRPMACWVWCQGRGAFTALHRLQVAMPTRLTSCNNPPTSPKPCSPRVYWKDIASAEARDEVRAHNKHHQVLEVTSSRSSSLGLQELVHGDGGLAVEQCASAHAAPQQRTLLSALVESKLLEHAQKKLDATIQAEWEVVDTRAVDEEEYVML